MTHRLVAYAAGVLTALTFLSLAGCAGLTAPQVAADVTLAAGNVLSPSTVAGLQNICRTASPILSATTSPAVPKTVSDIAAFPASYCQQMSGGIVPPTTDANTSKWLTGVLNTVQVAAQVAQVALPLIALF